MAWAAWARSIEPLLVADRWRSCLFGPGVTYAATPDGQRFLINTPTDAATAAPITIVLNWKGGAR